MQAAASLERYRFEISRMSTALAPPAPRRTRAERRRIETSASGSAADEDWDWDEDEAPTRAAGRPERAAVVSAPARERPAEGSPPPAAPAPAQPAIAPAPLVEVPALEEGTGYVIKERKPVGIYYLLSKEVRAGRSALCICTSFPDRLKEKFGIHNAKFIWLTMIRESGQGYDPERLDFEVTQEVYEFITSQKGYVVLFDALDLLISEQGADKTVEFVRYLNDHAAMDNGILLVAAAGSLDESVMGNLERFLEELVVPDDPNALKRAFGA